MRLRADWRPERIDPAEIVIVLTQAPDTSGALEGLGSPGGLIDKLKSISVVRCDEAAWRFLGISLAGYNALISAALAAVAAAGAAMEWRAGGLNK